MASTSNLEGQRRALTGPGPLIPTAGCRNEVIGVRGPQGRKGGWEASREREVFVRWKDGEPSSVWE